MRIRVRIYIDTEPELYALYKAAGPSLTRKIFKQAVKSYVDGTPFNIDLPPITMPIIQPNHQPNPMFEITLGDAYQAAFAELPGGRLSVFAKMLVRFYTFNALTDCFKVKHAANIEMPQLSTPVTQTEVHTPKPAPEVVVEQKNVIQSDIPPAVKPATDLNDLDNSDVNSLATLFGGFKMA